MTEILITGATGFVGSHLVEALARHGLSARAMVRPTSDVRWLERHGVDHVVADLSDEASLVRALGDADTVLHLAAATRALDEATFHRVNAEGTRHLVAAMSRAPGRRLVYLSSLSAVGPARHGPVQPDDDPAPITAYGRSKLEGERICLGSEAVDAVALRPPAVYGPRDRDLLTFFRLAKLRLLPLIGPRGRSLQLVHAADLAEAIVLAGRRRGVTGVLHIAEPRRYEWAELLGLVETAVGRRGLRVPLPSALVRLSAAATEAVSRVLGRPAIFDRDKARELLAAGWTCETEAARERLGFEATIPLRHGLEETAEWYRAYGWL